jgi:hypothetical protein
MLYVVNSFSLNMLPESVGEATIEIIKIGPVEARKIASVESVESAIGHETTARLVSKELGIELPAQRKNVVIRPGEGVLVAQYRGPRLPEGATELPEGATIEWYVVYHRMVTEI